MSETNQSEIEKKDLLIAVVQGQDADIAIESLIDADIPVTRLPSTGGFLGRKSATLMIGVSIDKINEAVAILDRNCRKRVAFIAMPMENSPLPMPAPTPVTVGGASIFSIKVEHFEEF